MIESYDFAVDLAVTKYNLNSQNTTAVETPQLIHYNRYTDKGFDHQKLVNQLMQPWIKRNINIASVLHDKNNLGINDFAIIGDGHLSIEGHKNFANILYDQIGHKIIKSCNN